MSQGSAYRIRRPAPSELHFCTAPLVSDAPIELVGHCGQLAHFALRVAGGGDHYSCAEHLSQMKARFPGAELYQLSSSHEEVERNPVRVKITA